MDDAFLTADNVNYIFEDGPLHVLADVSLSIQAGAFVALAGPSGVGKSTLLRLLAGLLRPSSGQITIAGHPAYHTPEPIGLVFQKDNLMPWRTVAENARLPLELQGESGPEVKRRVQKILDLVGLTGFEQNYPAQLSGGMAQRVALARALIHAPNLLLLDEPFGALDALTRERMGQELLRIWQAMPVTVIMVTHSITEAVFLADEVMVMGGDPGNGRPAAITQRIPIQLPRPRQFEMQASAEFQKHAAAIRAAIQQ